MKKLAILGSTGSIGTQTLDIVRQHPDKFKVIALASNSMLEKMVEQVKEFKPEFVSVFDSDKAEELRQMLKKEKINIDVLEGANGSKATVTAKNADTVVTSIVGAAGLIPTVQAIEAGKNLAIANKETLVCAGKIVMEKAKKHNINIMPIDSEHCAIFQCLNGENKREIDKLYITCSGGAFKNWPLEDLPKAKAADALKHPTWTMGPKITIDSATLMNKGLEVIEAHWLYDVPYDRIEAIGHPESIIHSMVQFVDGGIMGQIGVHDMRVPIQYALSYPERLNNSIPKLNFYDLKQLTFRKLNTNDNAFPCLKYAYEAGEMGGTMPAVMNAANEIAVYKFLEDKIGFMDIPKTVRAVMDNHNKAFSKNPALEDILEIDKWARKEADKIIGEKL